LNSQISISGISTISALGATDDEVWQAYFSGRPLFGKKKLGFKEEWVSAIPKDTQSLILHLQRTNTLYKKLDRTVLLAILAAKKAFSSADYLHKNIGVNIGSSRGATRLFEKSHERFITGDGVSAYTSPTTTLGNISSWVGQEIGAEGVEIGHSVTCSTSLHAILNGIAWLKAGMADAFVVGGSEAALTSYTLAQMKAMKLYSNAPNLLACESMNFEKKRNTMVIGEAAGVAVLEKGVSVRTQGIILGYGFASEKLSHLSSISETGVCFQKSMIMALQKANVENVDAVVMHAPGTVKGDLSELNAINTVFGKELPLLTSNKWLVGHTFGASGMLNIEMAILMLKHNRFIENPFFKNEGLLPSDLKTVLVNAVGFGGNAVSIIISKP
jgi:3-oxoacyl-(acyl-carrier-protein) synthase